ncbi:hypothetical protein CVIRNUC_001313 [Coccomyxa viridis]|uniref:PHD-type domain-containing protein n=1 Tax=Coccomyxa viridis TaxID=1274662 RepID=A0AAV1HWV2_9CHLO|nr:hypothetical protein CVIRNUC_001313 [Coccomyxa viridis]
MNACAFCGHDAAFSGGCLGPLLGPVATDQQTGSEYYVHRLCAVWSPEVYQTMEGTLRCVTAALRRGRTIKCAYCRERGATIGCRVEKCTHSFHLHCARGAGCTFYPSKHIIACITHAPAFKHETEKDRAYPQSPYNPVRRRKKRLQQRTQGARRSHTEALPQSEVMAAREVYKRACTDARMRQAESSDDEEHFRKKEQRRTERDTAKLRPLILSKEGCSDGRQLPDWSSLGGLQPVIRQLKEMVILPLLYPDLYQQMGISAPRGILFYGEPGTGKTLTARALAGSIARRSPRPVAFFSRKGADCLGKFSGEAERTLRLLFEEAAARAPSIVFLDELDGLVPARSAGSDPSAQIYASVVSTLLALMDGVSDRGDVIVVGATNRPEAIDQALRRPGRFDREVYFGLPSLEERSAILGVHTCQWTPGPSPHLLRAIAAATEGYAGADLRALCAGAVMAAVRRSAPQILLDPRMEQGIPLGPHLQPQASDDDAAKAWQQQQQGANLGQSIFLSSPSEPEGSHRSANGGEKQGCSLAQGTSGGMALEVGSAQTDAAEEQDGTLQHSQHAAVSIPEGSRAVNRAAPHPDLPDGSAASLAPLQSKHAETPASAQPEPQPETGNSQGPALGCTGPNAGASHMAFDGLPQEQHVPLGTAGVNAASVASLLEGLSVRACDWRKALASAPEACARRDSLAVLSADAAQPLPAALAPALLPACASALQILQRSGVPLPAPASSAADAAAAMAIPAPLSADSAAQSAEADPLLAFTAAMEASGGLAACSRAVLSSGVDDALSGTAAAVKHTQVHVRHGDAHQACRLLVAGQGEKGQEAVGGALLKLLGGCPCAVLGLPQLMAAGMEGSPAGLLSLLRAKAGRVPDGLPLVLYLPRVEAWASGAVQQDAPASELSAASDAAMGQMQRQGPAVSAPLSGLQQHSGDWRCEIVQGCSPERRQTGPAADGAHTVVTEACVMSELFMLLQQALGRVASTQPLIVLATAHVLPEDMHPDLLRFFCGKEPPHSMDHTSSAAGIFQTYSAQALRNVVLLEDKLPSPKPWFTPGKCARASAQERPVQEHARAAQEVLQTAAPAGQLACTAPDAAQLQSSKALQTKVEEALQWCGIQLLRDERLKYVLSGMTLEERYASKDPCPRLAAVAAEASNGAYKSLQDFEIAAKQCLVAGSKIGGRHPASHAISVALCDLIAMWCYSIARALKL